MQLAPLSFPTPLPPAFCQAFLAVCRNPWTILGERGRARGKCLAQEYNTMTGKVSITCGTYWHWVPCVNLLISLCLSCLTLYTLTLVFIFSTLISLHSFGNDKENLLDNQELLKLVIISIILVTFTFSSRVVLWGEFRGQSLLRVKGLLKYLTKKAPNMPCERKWVPSYLLWLLSSKEPHWFNCTEDPSLWLSMAKELLPYAVSKSRLLCLLIEFRIKWLSN